MSSCSQNSVTYALSKLQMLHLKLKEEQEKAICTVYEGKDVFVLLPTGYGKSICFQILPYLYDHKLGLVNDDSEKSSVIVVSPLIALMVDQVRNLRGHGVEAVIISSGSRESSVVEKEFLATDKSLQTASLIFSSPEALAHSTRWRDSLERVSGRVRALRLIVCQSGKFQVFYYFIVHKIHMLIFTS